MDAQVRTEKRAQVTSLDPTIWILECAAGGKEISRAEIWPAQGFNCFRWILHGTVDVLYADPKFLEGSSPTRTGIPILFPFPNRIRAGRFAWDGKEYTLPTNDPTQKNAIHGFACRRPWRVVDQGTTAGTAWITGEFQGSRDAPDCKQLWPADYRIRVTYRLGPDRLVLEASVENPDRVPLPCGLGYHQYFRIAGNDGVIQVPARSYWELQESLPTGKRLALDRERDLNQPRPFQGLTLDDVLTDLPGPSAGLSDMCFRGSVKQGSAAEVRMYTAPGFRETVVFTPPHRQAFCIEPYTCTTDAVNLQQRGVDAGLMVLQAGDKWTGIVEMRLPG
jgi:aldose 1-epimerase